MFQVNDIVSYNYNFKLEDSYYTWIIKSVGKENYILEYLTEKSMLYNISYVSREWIDNNMCLCSKFKKYKMFDEQLKELFNETK